MTAVHDYPRMDGALATTPENIRAVTIIRDCLRTSVSHKVLVKAIKSTPLGHEYPKRVLCSDRRVSDDSFCSGASHARPTSGRSPCRTAPTQCLAAATGARCFGCERKLKPLSPRARLASHACIACRARMPVLQLMLTG
eukprot:5812146-Pleurochrysis_carterae.AAC.1